MQPKFEANPKFDFEGGASGWYVEQNIAGKSVKDVPAVIHDVVADHSQTCSFVPGSEEHIKVFFSKLGLESLAPEDITFVSLPLGWALSECEVKCSTRNLCRPADYTPPFWADHQPPEGSMDYWWRKYRAFDRKNLHPCAEKISAAA